MASRRERIVQAAMAALEGVGKPAALTVHRSPTRPVPEDQCPAMAVFSTTDPASEGGGDLMDHRLELVVESRARATTGESPEQKLDELYVWAVHALMADPTLGGLAVRVLERESTWDLEERSAVFGALQTVFHIEYETLDTDPEA